MGVGWKDFDLIVRFKNEGYVRSNVAVVEIGAQQLSNDILRNRQKVRELGQAFGITNNIDLPGPTASVLTQGKMEHLDSAAPFARLIWTWLGFEYASIDIDGSPESIPLDLNFDDVPRKLKGHFQLVTNLGTTEHVANQLQAFKIIHDLTAPGGLMIHHLPTQGYMNHGLVNYNMKFFWMLARSNGYKWVYSDFTLSDQPYNLPENIADTVRTHEGSIDQRAKNYKAVDCGLVVALQKVVDIEFVPPIDVPTGAIVTDKKLRNRYWTVFNPDAFRMRKIPSRLLSNLRRRFRVS
jgi:Methyltransferase domain